MNLPEYDALLQRSRTAALLLWAMLTFFFLAIVFSFSDWRLFVFNPEELPLTDASAVNAMPHDYVLAWLFQGWEWFLNTLSVQGLILAADAAAWRTAGVPLTWIFLALGAALFPFLFWKGIRLWALMSRLRWQDHESDRRREEAKAALEETQVALTAILVDPAAQEYAEDLRSASKKIREAIDGL